MTTKKRDGPHFVMVTDTVLDAPAWRAMSHGARGLYIALKRRYWPNRKNNGHIYLPQRKAAKELGSGTSQVGRWFCELQYYGFAVMMSPGCLGVDGKGRAPHWRLTEVAYMRGTSSKGMEDMPTTDFLKWDGVPFSKHQPGGDRAKPKTEPRSGKREHIAPENGSTSAPENGSTRRIYRSGKREHVNGPSAPENGDISINHMGGGEGSGFLLPEGELAKKPWSTPTVEEVPWDTLPTEMRMLVLGLPDAGLPPQAGAVPDVPDQAEPLRPPADHYAPGGLMDYVNGVTEEQLLNLDEAKEAKQEPDQPVSAPVSTPDPANDRGERGLSSRRVQEHARWYSDAAYWSYSPNALAAGALDAELRAILRKEVSLEHVEIEFERVMKAVPR